MNTATKCLFGGALVATGLATHEAHAQEFVFIDTTATASAYSVTDTFSGPGTWSVEAFAVGFGGGSAGSQSTPISLSLSASGMSDTWGPVGEASVLSHFTVTSNTSATLETSLSGGIFGFHHSDLTFTDITSGIELLSVTYDLGLYVFDLLADHEYQLSSTTQSGFANLYISPQACPADLNNDGTLNYFDVSAFLVAFSAMDPAADFNNDGVFNFFDVSAFLTAFAAGCP